MVVVFTFFVMFLILDVFNFGLISLKVDKGLLQDIITFNDHFVSYLFGTAYINTQNNINFCQFFSFASLREQVGCSRV